MKNTIDSWRDNSYLQGENAAFIEELYEHYLENPDSVDKRWHHYFDSIQDGSHKDHPHRQQGEQFVGSRSAPPRMLSGSDSDAVRKQGAVHQLINAYRSRGHQRADLNPLKLRKRPRIEDLNPEFHGLEASDMNTLFNVGLPWVARTVPLHEIIDNLKKAYCGKIGSEYMHITDTEQKQWLQERLENVDAYACFTNAFRRRILERIAAAEGLEKYLHTRYVGQKRFSLEGGDSLIAALDELIRRMGKIKVEEVVIGMAHRGRLNVLINVLGKSPAELYLEFEGKYKFDEREGSGDVKYHKGFSSNIRTPNGPMHLALSFNPSHLEIINPVVEGSVRARQQRRNDHTGDQVVPILIHGDSAFAGQGVVMETLNMSQARGYATGGTVHIVINNQIGFTTSNPLDTRSTVYCTDVAKMVQAPVFHVNGDDPEAVIRAARLALEFRMKFKKDVVVDMVCYRRHGHNEADEPVITQPMMYKKIKQQPTIFRLYADHLIAEKVISREESDAVMADYRRCLDEGQVVARDILPFKDNAMVDWSRFKQLGWQHYSDTAVPNEIIKVLSEQLNTIPDGVELHLRVARILENRRKMAVGALPIDWGCAETLAYASLLVEGYPVRLSGQDCGRGTFSHRHAVLHSQKDGEPYTPLRHLSSNQARFIVIDSLLSEVAVLGFEYGFSTTDPATLVIWEGQFGDFANGAQVVIDQFISSGASKWSRLCNLVMFLPHGYEGQGPEHSSARLERYLQLCAEQNMVVCVPSTPAQIFHLLRRQVLQPCRKPLIVMTPKSLLRHKLAVSTLEDLSHGEFQRLIPEVDDVKPADVRRVVLCSGKVYYDLLDARRANNLHNVVVIRIEQLYPFPRELFRAELKRYANATEIVWCQEEPQNQGAWYQSQHHVREGMGGHQTLYYRGREASASPATGHFTLHVKQQESLVYGALGLSHTDAHVDG
ncbi:MAG: 2-oxoglutarate dehydrogenase E1 component [Gammaproteobacteria bacterium]|nr:2-oxoglutarate dehydrogenase E1 component [Gammaproteobacteria bacterium]